jgi:hypothetical protein
MRAQIWHFAVLCSFALYTDEHQHLTKSRNRLSEANAMKTENAKELPELSLMEGGPGEALMKKLRLIRPEFGAASARTAVILAALTWLPLLLFSLIEGLALGGARIPFLYDFSAHAFSGCGTDTCLGRNSNRKAFEGYR